MVPLKGKLRRVPVFGLGIKFKGHGTVYKPGEYERLQAEKAKIEPKDSPPKADK